MYVKRGRCTRMRLVMDRETGRELNTDTRAVDDV